MNENNVEETKYEPMLKRDKTFLGVAAFIAFLFVLMMVVLNVVADTDGGVIQAPGNRGTISETVEVS